MLESYDYLLEFVSRQHRTLVVEMYIIPRHCPITGVSSGNDSRSRACSSKRTCTASSVEMKTIRRRMSEQFRYEHIAQLEKVVYVLAPAGMI